LPTQVGISAGFCVLIRSTDPRAGEAVFSIKIGSVATALIFIARHLVSPALSIDRTEMQGKVVVITGANSGCGLEAARLLCSWNATVILACRDMDRAAKAAANIEKSLPQECTGKVLVRQLDLASMASVKKFAERFRESGLALHVLMCNAGFRSGSLSVTDDGIEMHYQVVRCQLSSPRLPAPPMSAAFGSHALALRPTAHAVPGASQQTAPRPDPYRATHGR